MNIRGGVPSRVRRLPSPTYTVSGRKEDVGLRRVALTDAVMQPSTKKFVVYNTYRPCLFTMVRVEDEHYTCTPRSSTFP
jgi:hypothetical protein